MKKHIKNYQDYVKLKVLGEGDKNKFYNYL